MLHPVLFFVKKAYIKIHEADKPNSVGDLSDSDMLASKYSTEIDLPSTNTNSAALGHLNSAVMKRVLRCFWVMIFTC